MCCNFFPLGLGGNCCQKGISGDWSSCIGGNCNDSACSKLDSNIELTETDIVEAESSAAKVGSALAALLVAGIATAIV